MGTRVGVPREAYSKGIGSLEIELQILGDRQVTPCMLLLRFRLEGLE